MKNLNEKSPVEKLAAMIESGKVFIYRGKEVVLVEFHDRHNSNEVSIEVVMDGAKQTFVKEKGDKLDLFLLNFKEKPKPVENAPEPEEHAIESSDEQRNTMPARRDAGPAILRRHSGTFSKLADMLMEDMVKVRADKEYVPQAKQSANTANAIINLAKLELEMLNKG